METPCGPVYLLNLPLQVSSLNTSGRLHFSLDIGAVQGPMHNQMGVAKVLGIPGHKVVARTKRIGGGFGGKETRAINLSCAAAVPAYLLRRAVRLIQDRDEDMQTSGHRHPFLGRYKVLPPCGKNPHALPLPPPLTLQQSLLGHSLCQAERRARVRAGGQ